MNFTYDELNRVLTENYSSQAGTEIEYDYDLCTEGVSRLCFATSTGAVIAHKYNALGLQATTTTTIDNASYVTGYRYDRQGNLTNVVYPDNSEVRYAHNAAGLPETVEQKENGGSFGYIVSDLDYGPHGQVTYKLFGNGVESTYTFDATKLYRLQNILTVAPEGEGLGFGGGSEFLLAMNPARHPLAIAILDPSGMPEHVQDLLDDIFPPDGPSPELPDVTVPTEPETPTEPPADLPAVTPDLPDIDVPANEPMPTPVPPLEQQPPDASTEPLSETSRSIERRLEGKSASERVDIKSAEIAKINSIARTSRKNYDIEIVSMNTTKGGVEVFARAWAEKGQIGFGTDGSVEIERFRILQSTRSCKRPDWPHHS